MSKLVSDRLPERITRAFDGQDLESKIGPAHLLVTTDQDGTPRPCMLSAGEVLATGDDRLRLILWTGSTTCRNLARGGPVQAGTVRDPGPRGRVRPARGDAGDRRHHLRDRRPRPGQGDRRLAAAAGRAQGVACGPGARAGCSPQRRTRSTSIPKWSRTRPTVWSTISSSDRGRA